MPLSKEEETRVSGHGYFTSSVFSARGLLESIEMAVDEEYYLEGIEPRLRGGDTKVFKVTITVEEV